MDHKRKHSFGFDAVMRAPDAGRFRRWYAASSRLPPAVGAPTAPPGR